MRRQNETKIKFAKNAKNGESGKNFRFEKARENDKTRKALPATTNWSPAADKVTSTHGDQQMLETREWGGEMMVMEMERCRNPAAMRSGGGNTACQT